MDGGVPWGRDMATPWGMAGGLLWDHSRAADACRGEAGRTVGRHGSQPLRPVGSRSGAAAATERLRGADPAAKQFGIARDHYKRDYYRELLGSNY